MSNPKRSPILSIIIVAFFSKDEIGACLESLPCSLGDRAVEVVVVDNSPGDGTANIVHSRFPNVSYVAAPENLGFARGNNVGFSHSRGEHILFLNPDTICDASALQHCLGRIEEDITIGLISPKLVLVDGSMDLACRRSIPTLWDGFCRASGLASRFPKSKWFAGYNLTHLPDEGSYDVSAINGAFMMARRTVIETVGGFDEDYFMYGDDLDLCIRVKQAGYRIVYDGAVQIVHIKGVSVAKDWERMSQAIFDANRDIYLKHFNPRNSAILRWKYVLAFGLWKRVARWRARRRGVQIVRPG